MAGQQLNWTRHKKLAVTETDTVVEFTIDLARGAIDATCCGDTFAKFIPGRVDGTIRFKIQNPSNNGQSWSECMLSEEPVVYVFPDDDETTIEMVVTKVTQCHQLGFIDFLEVDARILRIVS